MINRAIKPLKEKLFELENQIIEISKSQAVISEKYDDRTAEYGDIILNNKQQKTDIKDIKKRTKNLKKRNVEEQYKLNELEQYVRKQNLKFQGVPFQGQ